MTGEPKVSTEVYKKYCLMRLVEIPIRRPIAVQTPNTFHSTKDFSFSIGEGFGFYLFQKYKRPVIPRFDFLNFAPRKQNRKSWYLIWT
ncbi:MAG: hypothetical protein RL316_1721 [Bacteroidota bacterium]|jgi:hypothetical protein